MIRLSVNGQQVAIPGETLAREVLDALPAWLRGGPASGQQGIIKSAIKGVLPMVLLMIHKDIVSRGAPVPPPDVRSEAARSDIIGYAANYLITTFAALADGVIYDAEGGDVGDGVFVVSGLVSRSAVMAEPGESRERAADDRAAAAAPTR